MMLEEILVLLLTYYVQGRSRMSRPKISEVSVTLLIDPKQKRSIILCLSCSLC